MFILYNTDAPIYYRPIGTVIMIATNCIVFGLESSDPEREVVYIFALWVGGGLYPYQWLTCNFLHDDIWHLAGNMTSFWTFGMLIEGKIGMVRSMLVYLAIGIFHGAAVQIIMLGGEHGICLGASGICFGMMAICLIWAPENMVEFIVFARGRAFLGEASIKMFVGVFLLLQIILLFVGGGKLSREFLHIAGAVVGFIIGIGMLRLGQVDCENWDIYSVWLGHHLTTDMEQIKYNTNLTKLKQEKAEQTKKQKTLLLDEIRFAVKKDASIPAFVIAKKMIQNFPNDRMPEPELLLVIKVLVKNKFWKESIVMMQEYIDRYTAMELPIRLNLAHAFLMTDQPYSAERTIMRIDPETLTPEQQNVLKYLTETAKEKAPSIEQYHTH
ncbi:MAG: rhomboid family intramembrane serine protease [Planctomycetaceae bacterium]|jgi:membrane associated rhomboid family serine protease|nr:rhomboid family intramembrane serine protease [Planctomycetaceae bacterium]